jgi:hypothetical protein
VIDYEVEMLCVIVVGVVGGISQEMDSNRCGTSDQESEYLLAGEQQG